ncbi:MAG: hypothetical protein LUQ39_07945 [Methanomassiliicoccales archaeon]|nr:hypothetical protein [Methanomassiliicoccales archaeon]
MEIKKNDGRRHSRLWLSMIIVVVFAMVLATCMPMVMAGKPVKPPVSGDFNLMTLDSRGDVGRYPRAVIGGAPDYAMHITYYDSTNHALKYATNKGGWTVQTVTTVGNRYYFPTGGVADLALDANGKVHIIYVNSTMNNELDYVNNVAGTWSSPIPLLASKDVMGQPSMAIDSQGMFHICYWQSDLDGSWITYGYGSPGAMTTKQVVYGDNNNVLSWYMSMAVDSNNVAHMVYVNLNTRVLTYTNSLDWTTTIEMSGVDILANIAIGLQNSVHLSYFTYPDRALCHALLSGGSFTSTVLDNSIDPACHHSAIAIDSNGCVHISYMDYPVGSSKTIIKYVSNVGGTWNAPKVVDGSSNAGNENDIAVGPGAKVHIAYFGVSSADLKYAEST